MATATTTTTIVAVVGMVETVADTKTLTIIAQIAAVVIPSSKATTPAYRSAKLKRGKVMATVTTATTSAVATGTVATVVQKLTPTSFLFCNKCACLDEAEAKCSKPCKVLAWVKDKKCDDENNHCGCNWDGGDCCGFKNDYR